MPRTSPQRAIDLAYAPLKQASQAMEALQQMLSGAANDINPENLYWLIQPIQNAVTSALDEIDSALPEREAAL